MTRPDRGKIIMKALPFIVVAIIIYYLFTNEYYSVAIIEFVAQFPLVNQLFYGIFSNQSRVIRTDTSESANLDVAKDTLLTKEELQNYGSNRKTGRLYLGILGQIFDVTKGKKHYGPGGGYEFFTGRDASRAFVTGDFSEAGLSDDVLHLSHQQLKGLKEWSNFYRKGYTYVGKLVGRYYDSKGQKTQYLKEIEVLIKKAEMEREQSDAEKLEYPPCNTEWSVEKGSRVWCSNRSGGVIREWIGVPRKLFVLGSSVPRCACIRHPSEGPSENFYLNNPKLEEYPGCPKDASSCKINT